MRTRLTRRGWVLVGVVGLGVGMAAGYGARALDAVVLPCVVALLAGGVRAYRADAPGVTRVLPAAAPAGSEGTVTLRFDPDHPVQARVRDRLPPGLAGTPTAETVLGTEPVRYRVRRRRRGRHPVGPVAVYTTDVLGLVETRRDAGGQDPLLVYPPVRDLPAATLGLVRATVVTGRTGDRDEFAGLREYVRGDSPRDVNWKASAKRDDLIVTEFSGGRPQGAVTLAAGGAHGRGDAMAEAAASLGVALLREGIPVTLLTAADERAFEPEARDDLLAALATARAGVVSGAASADVAVEAREDAVAVRIGAIRTTFDRLASADTAPGADAAERPGPDGDRNRDRDRDRDRNGEVRA